MKIALNKHALSRQGRATIRSVLVSTAGSSGRSCSTWADPHLDSIVTVTLEPLGDGDTEMTIRHTALPRELRAEHEQGWALIARQLAQEVGARSRRSH
jgi:uncharacterized protein YndB with AHSA1/START domain